MDAVLISVPTKYHAQYIESAAKQGLDIFVEKPVAFESKEIHRLYDFCSKYGVQLCCGFQRRFDSSYAAAAQAIHDGKIGRPLSAHIFFGDSPCPSLDFLLSGGNIFTDLAVHDVDFIRWVLQDEVRSVYATAMSSSVELEKNGIHDNATLLLKFRKG